MKHYLVGYEIRTGMDGSVVHEAHTHVIAVNKKTARSTAIIWVQDNDYHFDDRIDPRVVITEVADVV